MIDQLKLKAQLFEDSHFACAAASDNDFSENLRQDNLRALLDYCSMTADIYHSLLRNARQILKDTSLLKFFNICCTLHREYDFKSFELLPSPEDNDAYYDWGAFFLLVALAAVTDIKQKYNSFNIPAGIIQDSCSQIKHFCDSFYKINQRAGIEARKLNWLRNYLRGRLFRLGRMEYRLFRAESVPHVFRCRKTGTKVLIANGGTSYDSEGYVSFNNASFCDCQGDWMATFSIRENRVFGYMISPYGFALPQLIDISLKNWEHIAGAGDLFIDMHIPAAGAMPLDTCLSSMRQAFEFFEQYFPAASPKGIFCASWIFDPLYEKELPDSNIAKFMRELYLFPYQSNGKNGFECVFLKNYDNLKNAPRQTKLQRLMLDILETGGKLRAGGMLFFAEDIDKTGSQFYRSQVFDGQMSKADLS